MIGISVVGMLPEQLRRRFLIPLEALMMFLRIQCLYRQWKIVYYSVGLLFLVQTGIYAYLLSRGQRTFIVLYHINVLTYFRSSCCASSRLTHSR